MSAKVQIIKKMHKRVRKAKVEIINSIAKEMLTLPFKQRFKLSMKILFKGKL